MPRYIDADALYKKTAELEASALEVFVRLNSKPFAERDEVEKAEWNRWMAILGERSAFKYNVADAPTVDVQEVITLESAIDFLHKTGWLQEHDKALTESVGHKYEIQNHCLTCFFHDNGCLGYCPFSGAKMEVPDEEPT